MIIETYGYIRISKSLYIELDHQIGKYLRKLFEFYTYKTIKLQRPSRQEHITIIREGFDLTPLLCYNGVKADFIIVGHATTNGNSIVFRVECPLGEQIRKEFNYEANNHFLHFCIGYLYEGHRKNSTDGYSIC